MKIKFNRLTFLQALNSIAPIADSIGNGVKLVSESGLVFLMAGNNDFAVRVNVDVISVTKDGEYFVDTKKLVSALEGVSIQDLSIELLKGFLCINGFRCCFKLAPKSSDEFPDVDEFAESAYHEVPAKVLKEMIRRTTFATEANNTRYTLGCVCFELIDDKVAAVATDGHRMAIQTEHANCVNGHHVDSVLFRSRDIRLIEQILNEDEETVKISVSANRVLFQYGRTVFFIRPFDGLFPRWRNIIPEESGKTQVDIFADSLLRAVKACGDEYYGCIIRFSKGLVTVSSNISGDVDAKIEIGAVTKKYSHDIVLRIDRKFLLEFLERIQDESYVTFYVDEEYPITINSHNCYKYIVIPKEVVNQSIKKNNKLT